MWDDPGFMGLLGGLGSGLLRAGAGGQPIGSRGQALADIPLLAMQGQLQGMQQAMLQRKMQQQQQRDAAWAQMVGGQGQGAGTPAPAGAPAQGGLLDAPAPGGALAGAQPGQAQGGQGAPAGGALAGIQPNLMPLLRMMGPEQGSAMLGRILAQQPQTHVVAPGGSLVDNTGRAIFQAPAASKLLSPEEFAQRAQLAQLGAARNSMNVRLPPMENSFAQTTGSALGKEAAQLGEAGARAADTIRNLDRFSRAMDRFPTGAAANARLTIGQWAQQLGIPDSALPQGMDRNAVASAEEMRSISSQMLTSLIGPGGFPANNFSDADRKMLENALANIGTTPEGNRTIIEAGKAAARRNLDVARAWRDWQMQHGTTAESYLAFQQQRMPQIRERDVIAPLVQPYVQSGTGARAGGGQPRQAAAPAAAPAAGAGSYTAQQKTAAIEQARQIIGPPPNDPASLPQYQRALVEAAAKLLQQNGGR